VLKLMIVGGPNTPCTLGDKSKVAMETGTDDANFQNLAVNLVMLVALCAWRYSAF